MQTDLRPGASTDSTFAGASSTSSSQLKFPPGSRLVNLREGSKAPASTHGHHDAIPQETFIQTGTNVGLVLDGMFVAVDIDHPDNEEARALSARCLAEAPRVHKTPRGSHYLFRTQPEWSGSNTTLRDKNGAQYGDIKALGYVVGPGSKVGDSEYSLLEGSPFDPPLAPQWLLAMAVKPEGVSNKVEERSGIPNGEHDNFLTSVAGFLRGRHGLDKKAIASFLEMGPMATLEGIDETHPYTTRDMERIARRAAGYSPAQEINVGSPVLQAASELEFIKPPIEWVVRGFIPRAELVLMYGPGGIGKSSAGSWVFSEETRRKRRCLYIGTEESPERFIGRSYLAGADLSYVYTLKNPGTFKFPRDSKKLYDLILEGRIDYVHIDSIYTHFEHKEGQNAAEKARDSLAPLLAISHETGCTIFGVFHTNKAGAFLGSTEMENVARCLLEAKRSRKQTYLGIKVHKTNLYHPGKMMRLEGREEDFHDAKGQVQMEYDDAGALIPWKVMVPYRISDVDDDPDESDPDNAPMEFSQESLSEPKLSSKERIREYLRDNPAATGLEASEQLNIPYNTAKRSVWEINNDK